MIPITPPTPIFMYEGKQVTQLQYFELTEKNTRAKFFDCPLVKDQKCYGCKIGTHAATFDLLEKFKQEPEMGHKFMSVYQVAFVVVDDKIVPYNDYVSDALAVAEGVGEFEKSIEYLQDETKIKHVVSQLACQLCPYGHMLECHYPHDCGSEVCKRY